MRSARLGMTVNVVAACVMAVLAAQWAHAQTYKVLHAFCPEGPPCSNGASPYAGVIRDAKGKLYGTTVGGGRGTCNYPQARGCGTVFRLSKWDKETVLYAFKGGADGANPTAGVIRDAQGNLYGTTYYGGDLSCGSGAGCGTVFKLSKTGKETVLYSFKSGADGANPYAGVIQDGHGNLYGTTWLGGGGRGVVFKISKTGKETILYGFNGAPDGANPTAGVTQDAQGNLYGTTTNGGSAECSGNGCGTVFRLSKTGQETVLYSFKGEADGLYPHEGVIRDEEGNLYGTTLGDGLPNLGTVFTLDKTGKETVLHSFGGQSGDGAFPLAGVVQDAKGNLYGTTNSGGVVEGCGGGGCGVVFKLDKARHETVLHSFCSQSSCADGAFPYAGVIQDAKGNLYGTTWYGSVYGYGVVFKMTP
jgi:uncharacterized repeat protein (TIGR03803 family)